MPWYTRNLIAYATITLDVKHYFGTEEDTFEHIDIDQTLTGGIKGEHIPSTYAYGLTSSRGTNESRTFSGLPREHSDYLFGDVIGVSKRVKLAEITEEFLTKGWTADTLDEEKGLIYTTASSKTETTGKTWTAEQVSLDISNGPLVDSLLQIWGFEEIDGVKYYAR